MAFETQTINIKTNKILATSEFAVNTKINLDTQKPLKKVLSIKALADVSSAESVDIDFTVLGKTQINVVYLTETEELECVTGFVEWQNSTKAYGENLQAKVVVAEASVNSANSTYIDISCLQNMFVTGIDKQELQIVNTLSADYVANYKQQAVNMISSVGSGKFVNTENIEMPNAARVVSVDASSKVKNAYCGIDQISIEGETSVKILYATQEGYAVLNKTLDFKQEVACLGALMEHSAFASVNVSSVNATLETGDKNNLVLAVGLNASVSAYHSKEFNTITDLYSLNKELNTITDCVNYNDYKTSKYFTDTVVANVNLDSVNVDEIISLVGTDVNVAQHDLNNGSLVIEGVVNAWLIYRDNQAEEISSMPVVCPFVSNIDCDISGKLDSVSVDCFVSSVKIRSGKEIEVVLDLSVSCLNSAETYFEYVKHVEEVSEKQINSSAITIYVTKEDETLFSVAKALNVLPETITNQNQVVDGKFTSGQRIFVYSPLNVEF